MIACDSDDIDIEKFDKEFEEEHKMEWITLNIYNIIYGVIGVGIVWTFAKWYFPEANK